MSLEIYKQKRQFSKTPEPEGGKLKKDDPIFVIQKHAASHLHYDVRLAIDGVLKSWAVPKGPCLDPKVKRLAVEVEDHPLEYAKFEGNIPKGEYGGGTVMVWDYGRWEASENLSESLREGRMHFILQGQKLQGGWSLIRTRMTANKPQWLLIKLKDQFSQSLSDYDITKAEPNSAITQRTMNEIAKDYGK